MKSATSIKHKLVMIITATCFSVLVIMGFVLLMIERSFIKDAMHDQFVAIGMILADQNTASLSFDDSSTATKTLEAVSLEKNVVNACIYKESGRIFAKYTRPGHSVCMDNAEEIKTHFTSNYLIVFQKVMLDKEVIGSVYLRISLDQVNQRLINLLLVVSILIVLVSLVALFMAQYLQGIVSRPILKLASIAKNISEKGIYDISIKKENNDEIGELYSAFNEMLFQIRSRQAAREEEEKLRRESEAQVRLLLESTAEAIYGVDKNGRFTIVNPACLKILGYKNRNELLELNTFYDLHHKPSDTRQIPFKESKIFHVIQSGEGIHVESEKMYKRDGSQFYAEYWVYPINTQSGTVGAVVTFIDISERKQVEQELKNYQEHLEEIVEHRTEEIKLAYKELEAFSYSVSHDLRAPLRAIDGFSQLLAEDYEFKLDEIGRNYLSRIRGGAQKMSQLIDDLLTLAKAMRGEISRKEIDLAYEATEVISELKASEPDRIVYFDIEKEMKANADPTLMRVVVENLFSNAWKYTSKKSDAHIKFSCEQNKGEIVYYLKDDGAGFDMKYVDKLFHAFQRLHQPEDFPGTGIGLATVQRIISRHGGRIWANSTPKKGTTFYFTLPQEIS